MTNKADIRRVHIALFIEALDRILAKPGWKIVVSTGEVALPPVKDKAGKLWTRCTDDGSLTFELRPGSRQRQKP